MVKLMLDAADKKLLGALMRDSRQSIAALAKLAGLSREVANYRMQRLQERGIIVGYVTEINAERLGYLSALVFVSTKTDREEEFRKYLHESNYISWVGEHVGIWDFGMSIFGRTIDEVDRRFDELYKKFKDIIIDHRLTFHKKNSYFYEKLFGSTTKRISSSNIEHVADSIDRQILKLLSNNARVDYVELSKNIPLSSQSIKHRIRKLEKSGHILKYTIFIDYAKLDIYQYSIFIVNKNLFERKKLLASLAEHKDVCFVCEYVGDPFLEFGVFVDNPYDLRYILQNIEQSFPDNRIIEHSLQKETVSFGPAKCVFD